MTKRLLLLILVAALITNAAPTVSSASRPAATQGSSTAAKKKKKGSSSKSRRRTARTKGQTAPTPDRIKEIQSTLQKDGSYDGEPTGKWDAATAEAMKRYQDENGFAPTGKIDALSLHKLGLGSETAGKGAPVPANTAAAPSPTATSSVADPETK